LTANCLESNKILLGIKDVTLTIKLSHIPSSPINITFVSEDNFAYFNVEPRYLLFKNAISKVELYNSTLISVTDEDYQLEQSFTLKNKKNGKSSLAFNIQSDSPIKLDGFLSEKLDITVDKFSISNIVIIISTAMFLFSIGLSLSGSK